MRREGEIRTPEGKLGVLIPGIGGAVSTTFLAGVAAVQRKLALPIGSLTQMGTIRLGKRFEYRIPLIKDFVSLARLEDLVFGELHKVAEQFASSVTDVAIGEARGQQELPF